MLHVVHAKNEKKTNCYNFKNAEQNKFLGVHALRKTFTVGPWEYLVEVIQVHVACRSL